MKYSIIKAATASGVVSWSQDDHFPRGERRREGELEIDARVEADAAEIDLTSRNVPQFDKLAGLFWACRVVVEFGDGEVARVGGGTDENGRRLQRGPGSAVQDPGAVVG